MNLIKGKLVSSKRERDMTLQTLEESLLDTLKDNTLTTQMVCDACDTLSREIGEHHLALLQSVGIPKEKATEYIREAKIILKKEGLLERLKLELGAKYGNNRPFTPKGSHTEVEERILPLGTLLHITASNQYGLAFYSVIEGLLTGNINLVKLPSEDDGLSAMIFLELFRIEPRLADYVYLFDYHSLETETIEKLMRLADAVVVWGSDEAVKAVRHLADPTTKIIEWGHKLSFAYITKDGLRENLLRGLAQNIIETNQLLCSSCQGIFLDTDSMEDVFEFCKLFLPILEKCREEYNEKIPLEVAAQTGLRAYNESLQVNYYSCRVFQGQQSTLLAYEDSALVLAIPYGNCWVKRLPREMMLSVLRPHKNHLQTAGLLCGDEEVETLTAHLWNAGVSRVTRGENMSQGYYGAAHDGEYPLRRYTRIASKELPQKQSLHK